MVAELGSIKQVQRELCQSTAHTHTCKSENWASGSRSLSLLHLIPCAVHARVGGSDPEDLSIWIHQIPNDKAA